MNAALHSIPLSISPANTAAILARCTLWPFIVTAQWREAGEVKGAIKVFARTLDNAPSDADLVPIDAELLRCDVLPATRFDDLPYLSRGNYKAQYRAWLMWRKARAADKSPAELVPWVDFDPCMVDESVERWARPACRFAGD